MRFQYQLSSDAAPEMSYDEASALRYAAVYIIHHVIHTCKLNNFPSKI